MGVSQLDPRPEPSAQEIPTSMDKPGSRPSSNRLSRFVIGKATPLARPPTPESPDPLKVGKRMGGMVVVSSPYTGGVRGPSVGQESCGEAGEPSVGTWCCWSRVSQFLLLWPAPAFSCVPAGALAAAVY